MEKFDTISHPPFLRFERFELYANLYQVSTEFALEMLGQQENIIGEVIDVLLAYDRTHGQQGSTVDNNGFDQTQKKIGMKHLSSI